MGHMAIYLGHNFDSRLQGWPTFRTPVPLLREEKAGKKGWAHYSAPGHRRTLVHYLGVGFATTTITTTKPTTTTTTATTTATGIIINSSFRAVVCIIITTTTSHLSLDEGAHEVLQAELRGVQHGALPLIVPHVHVRAGLKQLCAHLLVA